MISKKGNVWAIAPGAFSQLEVKHLFPFDLMRKEIVGFADYGIIWIIYKEEENFIRVPFARNRKWFIAMTSEPEMAILGRVKQIYVV